MDQHISRLDTNTDDSGQQPNHGVGSRLRLLLQSFPTSVLDLSDLADNKAQPRHVALQLGHGIRTGRAAAWRRPSWLEPVHRLMQSAIVGSSTLMTAFSHSLSWS